MNEGSQIDIAVYTPSDRLGHGIFLIWFIMIKNISNSRDLVWQLFKRDFFAVYKKSFLGLGWLLLAPVLAVAQWIILQSAGLLVPGDTEIPYPAWVLMGSLMWGLFASVLENCSDAISNGRQLILQVSFPHEVLFVKQLAQVLATFLITFTLNLLILPVFGVWPTMGILILPIIAMPMLLLASGIGFILAMFSSIIMDVKPAVKLILSLLMLSVPIVYVVDALAVEYQLWISYNPLNHLICGCRDIVLLGHLESPLKFAVSSVGALVVFLYCWKLFYISELRIVERMA